MMDTLRKYAEICLVSVTTIIIALLLVLGVVPLYQELVAGRTAIAEQEIAQSMQLQRVFERPRWQGDLDMIAADSTLLDIFVPVDGIVVVVEDLEEIAANHGVQVTFTASDEDSAKFAPADNIESTATKAEAKTLSIAVQGQFSDVVTFLSLVEQYRNYAQIDNVALAFVPPVRTASRILGAQSSIPVEEAPQTDTILTFDATYQIAPE